MLIQRSGNVLGPFEASREKPVLPRGPLPPTGTAAGEGSTMCASRVTSEKYSKHLIVLENPYKCRQPYQTSHASFSCFESKK